MPKYPNGDKVEVLGVTTKMADIEALDQTISETYDAKEVQAISDKLDEVLAALKAILA